MNMRHICTRKSQHYFINKSVCVLTSLKVTFLLLCGSSTIFCKLAATVKTGKLESCEQTKATFTLQTSVLNSDLLLSSDFP